LYYQLGVPHSLPLSLNVSFFQIDSYCISQNSFIFLFFFPLRQQYNAWPGQPLFNQLLLSSIPHLWTLFQPLLIQLWLDFLPLPSIINSHLKMIHLSLFISCGIVMMTNATISSLIGAYPFFLFQSCLQQLLLCI